MSISLQMLHPIIHPFVVRVWCFHYAVVSPGLALYQVKTALLELQSVALMLGKLVFHLSNKVVTPPLDNRTAKIYLCNQGGTACLFLSRLACHILNLADKHLFQHTYLPISMWKPTIYHR